MPYLADDDFYQDYKVQNDISKFESLRSPHTMRIILDDKISKNIALHLLIPQVQMVQIYLIKQKINNN